MLQKRLEYLRRLFSPEQLDELLADRAKAFAMLKEGNRQQRCGALTLLCYYWELPRDILLPLCRSIVESFSAADEGLVSMAAYTIGRMCENSFDAEQTQFLAQVVLAPTRAPRVRSSAFRALRAINRVQLACLSPPEIRARFREDIDRMKNKSLTEEDLNWVKELVFDSGAGRANP